MFSKNYMLMAVAMHLIEEESNTFIHSRYRKEFYTLLSELEKSRRYRRIPRCALPLPRDSPWRRVFFSNSDQALITLTGLDFDTFNHLHERFELWFWRYTPFTRDGYIREKKIQGGRPRLLSSFDGLGLVLAWTRTRGSNMVLQLIFGLSMTAVSDYLNFCMNILVHVLMDIDEAKVGIPRDETIHEFMGAVRSRHPSLDMCWCTMDGLKLTIECSGDDDEQNMFYNGWTCDHYVSAVLVFCPDGSIPICCYNVPGSIHDSAIAGMGEIYDKLEQVYNRTGGCCTVDSAFARHNHPFLIKSGNESVGMTLEEMTIRREATSMRQAAEWGMRSFQASFPRLKDRLPFEHFGQRKVIMTMVILLYNLRTKKIGINQIRNVYMPSLNENVNEIYILADAIGNN